MKIRNNNISIKIDGLHSSDSRSERGFTVFVSVILSSILLIITLAIANIAYKETILSGTNKASKEALFAASSGVECALYWDLSNPPPAPQAAFVLEQEIECGKTKVLINGSAFDVNNSSSAPVEHNFTIDFDSYCAEVTVEKSFVGSSIRTRIESRGRNTCDTSAPRQFERGIEVEYLN